MDISDVLSRSRGTTETEKMKRPLPVERSYSSFIVRFVTGGVLAEANQLFVMAYSK